MTHRDLKHWAREVSAAILHLVQEHDVKGRMIDSQHVLLYGPRGTRPFKVSKHRTPKDSVYYVRRFARQIGCEHQ